MKHFLLPCIFPVLAGCTASVPPEQAAAVAEPARPTPAVTVSEPVLSKLGKQYFPVREKGVPFTETLWELQTDKRSERRNASPEKIRLAFMKDGFYRGRTGDVLFYGQYIQSAGNRVRISSGIAKEELSPDDKSAFGNFMRNIARPDSFRIRENRLYLMQGKKVILEFQKTRSLE